MSALIEIFKAAEIQEIDDKLFFNNEINLHPYAQVNKNNITSLDTKTEGYNTTLSTNLNNQITKQQTDHNLNYNELHTLMASQPGSQNTF